MPSKDTSLLDRQREIFTAALSVPENRRAAFLDEACQGDPALRAAVADLLAHHLEDDFLAEPAVDRAQDQEAEAKGGRIGPYRLTEEIGRGGMGVVFRAEQETPVKRQVAVKVIRWGLDTEEVIKRFTLERQVLAAMDHPHIARILDAGTTPSRRPYFVMELVEGVKVTTFCQRHRLTTCQRLQLFVDICAAVQHAHQKGIIHRDLKPGNVLVTMCDGKPIPKVIDFGIAKAIGEEGREQTALTRYGPFMGTMAYMSPEQAGAISAVVDTRTDIYALGVLLYEMLTGVTPFETGSTSGPEAFLRMIREEEPPRPSTRLTQLQKRSAKEARLPERKFARDIDWIVLKALEKGPPRRYETVNALALDIKRYLNDEPVSAIAPGLCYRFGKFIRRHRALTVGSAAVLVSLVVGLVLSLLANVREQKAREDAEDQRYASDMKVALMASLSQDRTELVSLLEKHRPAQHAKDRRGWLWHYLDGQCHQELRGTNVARTSLALATSPDGRWIAHAGARGTNYFVDILEVTTLATSRSFEFPGEYVPGMRFFQDSTRLVLDPPTRAPALEYDLNKGQLTELTREKGWLQQLTPNGRYLIRILDSEHGEELNILRCREMDQALPGTRVSTPFKLAGYNNWENKMHVSPDSAYVAVACLSPESNAPEIRIFSIPELAIMAAIHVPAEVVAIAWSPDSRFIVSGYDYPGQIDLWSVEDSQHIHTFKGLMRSPSVQLQFSPEGDLMASTELSGLIQIWEVATEKLRRVFMGEQGMLSFLPGGRELVTASNGAIKIFDTSSLKETDLRRMSVEGDLWNLEFTPDGSMLATSSPEGVLRMFDVDTETLRLTLESRHKAAQGPFVGHADVPLQFSTDGRRVGMVTSERTASVYELDSSRELCSVRHPAPIEDLSISPNGQWLATVGQHANLMVWNAETGKHSYTFNAGGLWLGCVAFSPNPASRLLAFSHNRAENNLILVRLGEDWRRVASTSGQIASLTFSPDGQLLVCGMRRRANVYDVATLQVLETIDGADGPVPEVSFSPDGTTLAIPCLGGFVQFWNRIIHAEVGRFKPSPHPGTWMISAQFSPDGSTLAMSTRDDGVHLLRMAR